MHISYQLQDFERRQTSVYYGHAAVGRGHEFFEDFWATSQRCHGPQRAFYILGKLVEIDLLKENEILRPVTCEYMNAESSDVHVMGAKGLSGSDGPSGLCHRSIF